MAHAKNKARSRTRSGRPVRRDRVRGRVRRASAAAPERQLRQLHERALAGIGFSDSEIAKWKTPPTVAFHFGLVGHGYEIHMFNEGAYVGAVTRDFSDSHKVEHLKETLVDAIEKAVKTWRAKL